MTPPRAGSIPAGSRPVSSGSRSSSRPAVPAGSAASGPGARRGGVGGPLLGPHGGDEQAALTIEQVGQAAQHRRAAVGVGVLAQLTQP